MQIVHCALTVLFQEPFWVGLFECDDDEGYAVARQVFGGEPSDPEVHDFVLERFATLQFSHPIESDIAVRPRQVNFKRALRQAKQTITREGIGTKAQQALQLELERHKLIRKESTKQEHDAEIERKFLMRQEKRKEKHRGH